MTEGKKKRLSMLDTLAVATAPQASNMMATNRALRSARDAVDGHRIWDLDPATIEDARFGERLDPADVLDLRASIEANGQAVPILVRRAPGEAERYLLVYGRRRLEAIRGSEKVGKVRALIAHMDETAAVRAQVVENTARRDLSFIERALFAQELLDSGFGNQTEIADVLNTTKSAVSMALSVARGVGGELARAIGPAHGIGRPRWEALLADLEAGPADRGALIALARKVRATPGAEEDDPSGRAFAAVAARLARPLAPAPAALKGRVLRVDGQDHGRLARGSRSLKLDLSGEPEFLDWLETRAESILLDLRARWRADSRN